MRAPCARAAGANRFAISAAYSTLLAASRLQLVRGMSRILMSILTSVLSVSLLGSAVPSARAEVSMGAEYETREGVVRFRNRWYGKSATYPEETMNERFLCTTEMTAFAGWPLVSFTHDMGWDNKARTLEIVLGPTRDGDTASAAKQATIIQKVYRFLHGKRSSACQSFMSGYCFVSVAEIKAAVPELTDDGSVCKGDFLARDPDNYRDTKAGIIVARGAYTQTDDHVWTQLTVGITTAELIDIDADKLFGKSRGADAAARRDLFKKIQAGIKKNMTAKTKEQQSLVLYSAYAIASFLTNEQSITERDMGGDGYHAPIWKNSFVLYPKTSVAALIRKLASDTSITAAAVRGWADLAHLDETRFSDLWDDADGLDQAKPSRKTTILLLEVRYPSSKLITFANAGDKDTMSVTIPPFAY